MWRSVLPLTVVLLCSPLTDAVGEWLAAFHLENTTGAIVDKTCYSTLRVVTSPPEGLTNKSDISVVLSGLSSKVTAVGLHCDVNNTGLLCANTACPVCIDLTAHIPNDVPASGVISFTVPVTLEYSLYKQLELNNYYVQASTENFPGGEVSGRRDLQTFLPTYSAEIRTGAHAADAFMWLSVTGTGTAREAATEVLILHTMPDPFFPMYEISFGTAGTKSGNAAQGHQGLNLNLNQLDSHQLDVLGQHRATFRLYSNTAPDTLNFYDTFYNRMVPVVKTVSGALNAAVYPDIPGYTDGMITVGVRWPSVGANNIGNTFSFRFNPAVMIDSTVGLTMPININIPASVEYANDVVTLRWTTEHPLVWYNASWPEFRITFTNVQLPVGCVPLEYEFKSSTCTIVDVMNAGVVFANTCIPSATDLDIRATPLTGVPSTCHQYGCGSCKYLYSSPVDTKDVFLCHQGGLTFGRSSDIMAGSPCPYQTIGHPQGVSPEVKV